MQGQPQRRPQGAPQRGGNNGGGSSTKALMTIAIIAVSVLLVLSLIIGAVVMAFNGVFEDMFDGIFGGRQNDDYSEDDGGNDTPKDTQKPSTSDDPQITTTLKLPQKSPTKNYVSPNASDVQTITGITSKAAILVDMSANTVIAAKNADTRVHPASMAKLMTLIVACENITKLDTLLTVEQWMIDYMNREEGSGVTFEAGQQLSVEDALFLISYRSDTVCCLLISKYVAGSEEAFVKMMNDKASAIGLTGTHFANTTGLYDEVTNGNGDVANDYTYTTCRDMAAIMNCAISNTAVKSIITSYSQRPIKIYVNNRYSHTMDQIYTRWYSVRFGDDPTVNSSLRVIAGKTGGEDIPSSCFVTVAKDKNTDKQYICVVIGRIAQNDGSYVQESTSTQDTKTIYNQYVK